MKNGFGFGFGFMRRDNGASGGGGGGSVWEGTILEVNPDGGDPAESLEFGEKQTVYTGVPSARYTTLDAALDALGDGDQTGKAIVISKAGTYGFGSGTNTADGFSICATTDVNVWTDGLKSTSNTAQAVVQSWNRSNLGGWTATGLTMHVNTDTYAWGKTLNFYSCTGVSGGGYTMILFFDNSQFHWYNSIIYCSSTTLWIAGNDSNCAFNATNTTIVKSSAGNLGSGGSGYANVLNGCVLWNGSPPSLATGDYNAHNSLSNVPGANSSGTLDSDYFENITTITDAHCASNAEMIAYDSVSDVTVDIAFEARGGTVYAGGDYVAA